MMELRDYNGDVMLRIKDNKCYDVNGNWQYNLNGSYICNMDGYWVYEIHNDRVYDTRGNWVLNVHSTIPKAANEVPATIEVPVKIMARFTDKILIKEKGDLEYFIKDCQRELSPLAAEISEATSTLAEKEHIQERLWKKVLAAPRGPLGMPNAEASGNHMAAENDANYYKDMVRSLTNKQNDLENKLFAAGRKLSGINDLLRLSEPERMAYHYKKLSKEKAAAIVKNDSAKLQELANAFNEMLGFRDTAKLAGECKELVMQAKYNNIIQQMNSASTEAKFLELARELRAMNGYKDTAILAQKCDELARQTKYNSLVQQVDSATTEEDYHELISAFRSMGSYGNTAQLIDYCYKHLNALIQERKIFEAAERRRQVVSEILGALPLIAGILAVILCTMHHFTRGLLSQSPTTTFLILFMGATSLTVVVAFAKGKRGCFLTCLGLLALTAIAFTIPVSDLIWVMVYFGLYIFSLVYHAKYR